MATKRHVKDERGVAMVEFALVVPLLMLVLVGIFEFGRVFNYWIDSTHLANEGARWAVVNRVPGSNLQGYVCSQAATEEMQNGLVVEVAFSTNGGQSFVTSPPAGPVGLEVGDPIRVRVTKTTSFPLVGGMLKILGGSGFGDITYRGTSTMRLEQLPTTYSAGTNGPSGCT